MSEPPARPRARTPKPPPPPKPWRRVEAGRYGSSDDRFTLESDGGGRWFVTDSAVLDELGLARTTGPFASLDAAKAAADAARARPADPSPLATRIAEAAARPRAAAPVPAALKSMPAPAPPGLTPAAEVAPSRPMPPPRTWLDDLADADRDDAMRARRLIAALERGGVGDAEALVRRDLLGGTPAVATRLLARAVLDAIAGLRDPSAAHVAEAVAAVLGSSPKRAGLPGWDLVERDGPDGGRRSLRVTADDLRAAAEDEAGRS